MVGSIVLWHHHAQDQNFFRKRFPHWYHCQRNIGGFGSGEFGVGFSFPGVQFHPAFLVVVALS